MSKSRLSRLILPRGVLIALGLLIVLLAVGSPDRASAQSASETLVSNLDETTRSGADLRLGSMPRGSRRAATAPATP